MLLKEHEIRNSMAVQHAAMVASEKGIGSHVLSREESGLLMPFFLLATNHGPSRAILCYGTELAIFIRSSCGRPMVSLRTR